LLFESLWLPPEADQPFIADDMTGRTIARLGLMFMVRAGGPEGWFTEP